MTQESFIAVSPHMQEIKKLATLLATIKTNVLITGGRGVGKTAVAALIAPKAPILTTDTSADIVNALKNIDEVIVKDIDTVKNIDLIPVSPGRIIATSTTRLKQSLVDKYFGMTIEIQPLSTHPEDILPLAEKFLAEAQEVFQSFGPVDRSKLPCDVSDNAHSLKRSIYQHVLLGHLDKGAITTLLENFFLENFPENDAYDKLLSLFDTAVIRAGHTLYKSQLAMAGHMGINRNTLRKKITELGISLHD